MLSIDDMFVFVLIFSFFSVPSQLQHRVRFYGILGAAPTGRFGTTNRQIRHHQPADSAPGTNFNRRVSAWH